MAASKKPTTDSGELEKALAILDQTISRVDDLKKVINDKAKSLTLRAVTPIPPAPSTEGATLPPPKSEELPPPVASHALSPEAGRYAVSEQLPIECVDIHGAGVKPKPSIPRPAPKARPVFASTPVTTPKPSKPVSGRFYIEVHADGSKELVDIREKLGCVGRIVDSGTGTASDPSCAWVEIATHDEISALVEKLRKIELREQVEKVVEVLPGEGRLLARQLDLCRRVR